MGLGSSVVRDGFFGFAVHAFVHREGDRRLCLGTYLSLKAKQQSENALAVVARGSCPLYELVKYGAIVAKRGIHLLSASPH